MNFWQFLDATFDRLPGWPDERQWVTFGVFAMAYVMLRMAVVNGDLWTVELFKILLQAIIISAIIGAIVSFHFTASKIGQELDTKRAETTGKMIDLAADAIGQNKANDPDAAGEAADQVAGAAADEADKIKKT